VLTQQEQGESVTSARSGRLEAVGDERWLVLERGQRNDFDDKTGDRTLSSFDELPRAGAGAALREAEARGRTGLALGMLLATANLLLLGLGLAATNPRRPSNWNLLFALLAFVVYFNLINLTPGLGGQRRAGLGLALAGARRRLRAGAGAAVVARPCRRGAPRRAAAPGGGMRTRA
jgi:lipopolysaccharide export system permease protein